MTRSLSAERSVMLAYKVIFSKYGLPKRIMSDVGGNFVSEKFKEFCRKLNIEQALPSSYHHQSNGQVEAYIQCIKRALNECFKTNNDTSVALLQNRAILL